MVRKNEVVIDKNTTLDAPLVCNTLTLVGTASLYNPHGYVIDAYLVKHLPAEVMGGV